MAYFANVPFLLPSRILLIGVPLSDSDTLQCVTRSHLQELSFFFIVFIRQNDVFANLSMMEVCNFIRSSALYGIYFRNAAVQQVEMIFSLTVHMRCKNIKQCKYYEWCRILSKFRLNIAISAKIIYYARGENIMITGHRLPCFFPVIH